MDALKTYLIFAIATFTNDTPDTDFQHGYLAALEEVQRIVNDLSTR